MKKVIFITTSHSELGESGKKTGVWLEEVATPYYKLKKENIQVDIASIRGGNVPLDPWSESKDWETEDTKQFKNDTAAMHLMSNSLKLSDISAANYDLVYFPGGHGPMWDFVNNPLLHGFLQEFITQEKPIAAMCHGVAALVDALDINANAFVKGRKITSFADSEEIGVGAQDSVPFLLETRLKELGATYTKGDDFSAHVVVDNNLVTGQNPASSNNVAQEMIKLLTA